MSNLFEASRTFRPFPREHRPTRLDTAVVTLFPIGRFSMKLGPSPFSRFTNIARGTLRRCLTIPNFVAASFRQMRTIRQNFIYTANIVWVNFDVDDAPDNG